MLKDEITMFLDGIIFMAETAKMYAKHNDFVGVRSCHSYIKSDMDNITSILAEQEVKS